MTDLQRRCGPPRHRKCLEHRGRPEPTSCPKCRLDAALWLGVRPESIVGFGRNEDGSLSGLLIDESVEVTGLTLAETRAAHKLFSQL